MAEDERLKGNECVKSKDFKDALLHYSRSIDLFPDEAATYCNRALVYLKEKEYARAVEDAEKSLKLKPGYLKAYHRRGKAYYALGKCELAIKDF